MAVINLQSLEYEYSGVTFVDGMSLERLKTKYWWVFNAKINDAIIGEDANGLVWYSGVWCCGTWKNGTWYSGIWESGTWENGIWHSYVIDKFNIVHDVLKVLEKNNTASHFKTGTWENGQFYEGTFGLNSNTIWNVNTGYTLAQTVWKDGFFHTGLIYDSAWYNGIFKSGSITNSVWLNGQFFTGTFDGFEWHNGKFFGGDFIQGTWYDGLFTILNKNVNSRFGLQTGNPETTVWKNGTFQLGEFHSGLKSDASGNPLISDNHDITHWKNGIFRSGSWYGGTFEKGEWFNGHWYDGVWGTFSTKWMYPNTITQSADTSLTTWNDIFNLTGDTSSSYAYLIGMSGFTGYTLANRLYASVFNFDLPSGTTVNGFRAKIVRSAYYDYYKGGLIDNSIRFSDIASKSSIDIPSIYAYSYNNSLNKETIYYGDIDTDWITGYSWLYSNVNNIVLEYQAKSWTEYSAVTDVIGYLYTLGVKIYHNTYPIWYNGVWHNGIWNNGAFYGGEFKNGVWIKGDFLGGTMM